MELQCDYRTEKEIYGHNFYGISNVINNWNRFIYNIETFCKRKTNFPNLNNKATFQICFSQQKIKPMEYSNISYHNNILPKMENENATQITYGYVFLKSESLHITEQIELYGSLFVVPFGLLFNFLSFITFYRCKMHQTATSLHLMSIAIADCLLVVGLLGFKTTYCKHYITIPDVPNLNRISCKGTAILTWFSFLISGMFLASATVERFLFIAFPLKIKPGIC